MHEVHDNISFKFMRLLIYAHAFAPMIGGVETYTRLLAEGLSNGTHNTGKREIEVTVITQTPAKPGCDAEFAFRVVRQPGLLGLAKLIHEATVLQLAGPCLVPMLIALLLRKPIVIEQHGYQAVCPNGMLLYEPTKTVCPGYFMAGQYNKCLRCNREFLSWRKSLTMLLLTFLRRWLCQQVAVNVAVTAHVQRRIDLPRSQFIYHGVPDPLSSQSAPGQIAVRQCPEPLCFAYVGRLVSEKGLPLLVEAVGRLREQGYKFHLKFVGDGPERHRLEASVAASELQPEVTFTGFLSGKKMEEALRDVAVVIMPSIWEETAGIAAIEQMFRGRLVIASDIGGLGEIVGTAGLKFPLGDVSALVNCMKQVLDKPDIVSTLGQKARTRALNCFGLERVTEEHLAIYDRLH
jgi:glycogen(starch) synthase